MKNQALFVNVTTSVNNFNLWFVHQNSVPYVGAIPLEAQRLGLESYASDLNPVAVMINKAMIEIPPKFAGLHPIGPLANSVKQQLMELAANNGTVNAGMETYTISVVDSNGARRTVNLSFTKSATNQQ